MLLLPSEIGVKATTSKVLFDLFQTETNKSCLRTLLFCRHKDSHSVAVSAIRSMVCLTGKDWFKRRQKKKRKKNFELGFKLWDIINICITACGTASNFIHDANVFAQPKTS